MEQYSQEQRAVEKLSTQLLGDVSGPVLLAWGNGTFGPSGKGHASAPNAKLRHMISHKVPIVLVNEDFTSQRASCCTTDPICLKPCRSKDYRRWTTVMKCPSCEILIGRDVNAAINIAKNLKHQTETVSSAMASHVRSTNHMTSHGSPPVTNARYHKSTKCAQASLRIEHGNEFRVKTCFQHAFQKHASSILFENFLKTFHCSYFQVLAVYRNCFKYYTCIKK